MRRALLAAAVALLAAAPAQARSLHDGSGLTIKSRERLTQRLQSFTFATRALPGPARVDVLLPDGYREHPRRRYPVLYLFHGTSGGAHDWPEMGNVEKTTAGLPLIVVMPDIGLNRDGGGWCADWVSGKYRWDTFHIRQLVPWVDANLRTRRSRGGRAIAGLSQGGFCSMSYAAQHPDLFGTAFSYSGAPDIAESPEAAAAGGVIVGAIEVGLDGEERGSIFGDPVTDRVNWRAHNPASIAENLRDTRLFLFAGNGTPGPLDENPINPAATAIEGATWRSTHAFTERLDGIGLPYFLNDYGAGTHTWPYWSRDLRESTEPLMKSFADPAPRPAAVTYTSGMDRYAVYGWRVRIARQARDFTTLSHATCRGFELSGTGTATVRTPPCGRRGRRTVTVTLPAKVMLQP
ncbi:MAG: alpha/beta hydrolase [Solirubrobacteraceae bacterium]